MTDVKTSAAPAKAQEETKSAAQKMQPAATIAPKVEAPAKPADRPGVFSDPDAGKVEPPTLPPIAERIEKLDRLNVLIAQRDEVTEALDNLQKFEQSPNGGQQVIFRSANGGSTSTHNPVAIAAMVAEGVKMLKAKLADIESQIIF
jgi:hypothetical protein